MIRPSSVLEAPGDRHALDVLVECRLLRPGDGSGEATVVGWDQCGPGWRVFHALRHLSTLGRRAEGADEWGLRQIDRAIDEERGFFHHCEAEPAGGHRGG